VLRLEGNRAHKRGDYRKVRPERARIYQDALEPLYSGV
jgi:hypothetical protein